MAKELGAATVDMDKIQIHPTVYQEKSFLVSEAIRGEGAILVNAEGKRFYNEMETRDNVSAAINALPERYAYVIFDQKNLEATKNSLILMKKWDDCQS